MEAKEKSARRIKEVRETFFKRRTMEEGRTKEND
jgi:hypothetical protein